LIAALRVTAEGVSVSVRAQPGAKRTAVVGLYGDQLKVAVQAPPVEGKANAALEKFFAESFGLSKSAVRILSGELNRSKVFLLVGVTLQVAEQKISAWIADE